MLTSNDIEYLTNLLGNINCSLQSDISALKLNPYISDNDRDLEIVRKQQNIESRCRLIERLNMVELESELDVNYNQESSFKYDPDHLAPFTDWENNILVEGDTIVHPSGEEGVIFFDDTKEADDRWWVAYPVGPGRLSIQIGERGQAVKKHEA